MEAREIKAVAKAPQHNKRIMKRAFFMINLSLDHNLGNISSSLNGYIVAVIVVWVAVKVSSHIWKHTYIPLF